MKNALPTESEIIKLHKKYAPSKDIFDIVYLNCLATWKIALQIIESSKLELNRELVKTGCLLHDIGTYRLIQPEDVAWAGYANRGVVGAEMLKEEGFAKELCNVVAHHVGLGLTKKRISETFLPVPKEDLQPQTTEERLVNYVSKLHSRSDASEFNSQFNSVDFYRAFLRKLDSEYELNVFESLVEEFGEPNLNDLASEFNQKLA